jgi:Staphylococcal nuclease homologue
VRLEFARERTDEYGQLLAYVHDPATGKMMNVDMIRSGYAQVYVVPPNTKHEDELRKAQDQAKSASSGFGRGIWSLPPAEAAQLADHGNGIGDGEGACPPESQIPRSASSSSATSSASPNPNQNVPNPNTLNPNATTSASSSASPAAGGSSSSASPAAGGGY